jgi:urease accessory protein
MFADGLSLLRLLQLADSAVPIGGAAHSFGLETLAADDEIGVEDLPSVLRDVLRESGKVDAVFCRAAHGTRACDERLNDLLSAMKPARESRNASLSLGRRFLHLAAGLVKGVEPREAHWAIAFGSVAGLLAFDAEAAVLAMLQQSMTGMVSAAQRLMPLGQSGAGRVLWDLKEEIVKVARESAGVGVWKVRCFAPVMEMASMRHVDLRTRLFIS